MIFTRNLIGCILILTLMCSVSRAQSFLHVTEDNGLPSDHVYGMITDRLGYLWICTDKGVAKYNGYEFRNFDVSNGLVSDDVWEVLEDSAGRIWLASFAAQLGYIYNDEYFKVKADTGIETIFPTDMRSYGPGVVFATPSYKAGSKHQKLCITEKDSLFCSELDKSVFRDSKLPPDISYFGSLGNWDEQGEYCYYIYGIYIHKVQIRVNSDGKHYLKYLSRTPLQDTTMRMFAGTKTHLINGIMLTQFGSRLATTDPQTGAISFHTVDSLRGNEILYLHHEKSRNGINHFHLVTKNDILRCKLHNGRIECTERIKIDTLLNAGVKPENITTVHRVGRWNLLGTTTSGAWKITPQKFVGKLKSANLDGYQLVGTHNDSALFWYNKSTNVVGVSDTGFRLKIYNFPEKQHVNRIVYYSGDTFLVLGNLTYGMNARSGKIFRINERIGGIFDGIRDERKTIRLITRAGYIVMNYGNIAGVENIIEGSRFNGIEYDSIKRTTYLYNRVKIVEADSVGKLRMLKNGEILAGESVGEVQQLKVDQRFGNVFILAREKLFLYDPAKRTCKQIFENLVFKDVHEVLVYNDLLCIVSKYGIVISKISGRGSVSAPLVNSSPNAYKSAINVFACKGSLFLAGAKEVFKLTLPQTGSFDSLRTGENQIFRFVVRHGDTAVNIFTGDTLRLDQQEDRLIMDVINHDGLGRLKLMATFDDAGKLEELNSNVLAIPRIFQPGVYYSLYVQASDALRKSRVVKVTVYLKPHWHQTLAGKWIIRLLVAGFIAVLIFLVIVFTKKVVLRRNEQRQARMELELRSIYAQINPHFIFNTLNSALLLISKNRMDDAYVHVSKFSRLLRSYLRSSRNKLVSVKEEMSNLRNYIELQQARFKNRFVYEVNVGGDDIVEKYSIPSLLIQPFVENAINHGLLPLGEQGQLIVTFSLKSEDGTIVCTIDDNGIGREQSRNDKLGREEVKDSYGDLIINDLVNAFNKYEKMNVHVAYYDKKAPATGTIVTITIKNPHYEP